MCEGVDIFHRRDGAAWLNLPEQEAKGTRLVQEGFGPDVLRKNFPLPGSRQHN